MSPFTPRIARTGLAATFAMAAAARAVRAQGHEVISLALGEPDFPTPPHIIEAAFQAARHGQTKYPPLAGTEALREAVRQKYATAQKLTLKADEILITNGGKQGIFNVLMALVAGGDEVLIPAPAWAGYEQAVQFAGGKSVFIPCTAAEGFILQPAALQAAITVRSKLLILNYPNNPTGAAITPAQLAALAEILRRHPQIWVLADDIYEHLLFDDFVSATLAAVAPDLQSRTITLTGVSKSYAMTGWRVGFLAGSPAFIKAATIVQASATSGVCSVAQAAALAALSGPQDYLAERAAAYQARRDLVVAALNKIPGITCHKPNGAFYVFPDITGLLGRFTAAGTQLNTATDFALALLNEAYVAVVQGEAFAAPGHVRIATAAASNQLALACTRMAAFCASLRPPG